MEIKKLLKMAEDIQELSLDDCKAIFADTYKFSDIADEIDDYLESGDEVTVNHGDLFDTPSIKINIEPFVHIITHEDFKELMSSIAADYKSEVINDFIEPYFNDSEYYKDAVEDAGLRDFLLEEQKDINKYEFATLNGKDYVVIQE